jgi:hypothetical protein
MSFESKITEKPEGVKEQLEKVAYHELRKEFDKRGIVDVWSPGVKKVELIEKALKRLDIIHQAVQVVKEIQVDQDVDANHELVKAEVKKVVDAEIQQQELIEKQEAEKQLTELDLREISFRKKYSVDGVLDLEAIIKAKQGSEKGLGGANYDKKKKLKISQRIEILEKLIKEAKK